MINNLGDIISINVIEGFNCGHTLSLDGNNGSRLGFSQMLSGLFGGYGSYDGYEIKTDEHCFLILISNEQNCCESWGYFSSNDSVSDFIGKTLIKVELTDTALNSSKVDESNYYNDEGGIQFVDFKFSDGTVLQFAVYNAHNGYYGHPILILKDENILLSDTL
jgi:hypothetical protein